MALCAGLGAALPSRVPLVLGVALAGVALVARRPVLLCLGAALLASALSARSWAGLQAPAPGREVKARATLVTDPVDLDGAVKVELRLAGGRRVEAWARGRSAAELGTRLAGERTTVTGRLSRVTGRRRAYLARRHVAARLIVADVGHWSSGGRLDRLANDLRRTLLRGASSLPGGQRALFAGFVLGDDRDQDPGTIDDFRAAGLSHLLAVSGQNVAFVLALAAPVLAWLGLRCRLLAGLLLLAGFGVLTRWEPSVLRAEAMAAVAMVAVFLGRPASILRVLALATTALVLIDPLLVGSVGFLLSCGACAGIALLAGPLGSRGLPLPLAVTVAAQVGVAPVLLSVFGGLPVASIPANLLAVPAAGPVMVWGLAAGLPAGLIGGPLATLVHLPTRLLVGWVAGVARWAAGLPLGQLRTPHVIALAVLAAAFAATAKRPRPPLVVTDERARESLALAVGARDETTCAAEGRGGRRATLKVVRTALTDAGPTVRSTSAVRLLLASLATIAILWPAGPGAGPINADGKPLGGGARLWSGAHAGATVLVVSKARPGPLLADLRNAGVRRLDVVVITGRGYREEAALAPVLVRHPARLVLRPATATPGDVVRIGRIRLDIVATEPRLEVRVRSDEP